MADLSKIRVNGIDYDLKDETARQNSGGGSEAKEWEEFLRFTTDNAETTVFDFSSNGVETLESKKVKEFYLYSPPKNASGGLGSATASILINNKIKITGLSDFNRTNGGYLKLGVFALSNSLHLYYFGRDSNIDGGPGGTGKVDLKEQNGILEASVNNVKQTYVCCNEFKNGILFPLLREDYIETITISLSAPCNNGIEFIVYVR